MTIPLEVRPILTDVDIRRGSVLRYFAQSVSSRKIYEIDNTQFNIFNKDPYYVTIQMPWVIVENSVTTDVSEQNTRIIEYYERTMPGLKRKLRNPREYFVDQSPDT
jgi:hypothetical protein